MAYQPVLLGSTPGDGTGDPLRTGGQKIDANFVELYAGIAASQPLDSDLTAIAALVTQAYGRSLLTTASAAAAVAALGLPARLAGGVFDVYCNFATGNDTTGDGSIGAPYKTLSQAAYAAARDYDWNPVNQSQVRINLADNEAQGNLHLAIHALSRAQGGAAFQIIGARRSSTVVANNGSGAVRLTVSTTNMTTGDVKLVKSAAGSSRGEYVITVVDGTHVDLVGSTYPGAFVAGDTIDGESKLHVSGNSGLQAYFGRPRQLIDLKLESDAHCAEFNYGGFWYLDNVTVCGGGLTPIIGLRVLNCDIILAGPLKIAGNTSFAPILLGPTSSFDQNSQNIHFTANCSVGSYFLHCQTRNAVFDSSKFLLHGHTVSGGKFFIEENGLLVDGGVGAVPNDWPGTTDSYTISPTAVFRGGGVPVYGARPYAKLINTTYNLATASGTQDVTGFGFNPTEVSLLYGVNSAFGNGTGFANSVGPTEGTVSTDTTAGTTTFRQSGCSIFYSNAAVNAYVQGNVTFITDGIRITWTKTGSPTGTLGISVAGRLIS